MKMDEKIIPTKFEYIEIPALRFIGIDSWRTQIGWSDLWRRKEEFFPKLEEMKNEMSSVLPYPCALMHHDDGEVDVVNRYIVGRFFNADTPVPDGYDFYDLKPQTIAFAVYDDMAEDKLWQRYELTRDRILSDGIGIPYPVGYWHAEVYFDKTPAIEKDDLPFSGGVLFACNK